MSDNIKVAIKVRPLIKREQDEKLPIQWVVQENTIGQIEPEAGKKSEIEYKFDHIFDMNNTNQDCFDATAKPIVDAVMKGFNGTIFAFGQTSSGKTYTMMGSKQEPGVTRLAVEHIFNYIENDPNRVYLLRVSYFEIYNEKINDLLNKDNTDMKLKEDTSGNVLVDCKEEMTNSPKDVFHAMKQGDKQRRVGETNMNERSSRSHTIFRITIESCIKDDPDGTTTVSQLNLVDLAGSERASQTGATGARFNEGRHINLSLSTLSLVIKQLSEGGNHHINFRDSKLTRVLQASLGGNALTTIICAVTPAALDETQCTLAFAQRAKGIKNKPQVNETVSEQVLIKRMMKQMTKLMAEMGEMKSELEEKDKEILMGRVELIRTKMISGSAKFVNEDANYARRRRTWGGPTVDSNPLPINSRKFGLETISENEHLIISDDAEEKKKYEKRRQSVMQQVNSLDLSFCSEIPDFEMELIKAERERLSRESSGSFDGDFPYENRFVTRRIQFSDSDDRQEFNNCSPPRTPERKHSYNRVSSPGTPKAVLRQKINALIYEYNDLREFTTLEKQVFQDDKAAAENHKKHEKQMEFMQKSLNDSEQLCKDLNKKYSELQSDFSILTEQHRASVTDCESLTMQVESLAQFRDGFAAMEAEKKEYQAKWMEASNRLAVLEGESSSHEYEMEVIKEKHKKREQELEASLNSAWEELKNLKSLNKDPKNDTLIINGKENDQKLLSSSANESMSIFENNSYFENMDVSVVPGDSLLTDTVLTNQDNEENDGNDNDNTLDVTISENSTKNISVFTEVVLNNDLSRLDKKSTEDLNLIILELSNVKKNLEDDNSKLEASLQAKIQETDDLKNDFQEFRSDMENLQKTVLLLTTENSELAAKLASEKEAINELKARYELDINRLMDEKKNLELNAAGEEDQRTLIENLKNKIEFLSRENIELSSSLMDKIEELDAVKQEFDAEIAKNNILVHENLELSNNLMEKIEEFDNMMKKIELERQSNEATKANENLTEEQALEIPKEENNSQVELLKNQVEELKSLNAKLTTAKLTSCSQCIHLVEQNEIRKVLKNDVKTINKKLKELQDKFDQESADADILRSKVNEDANISILNDTIFNTSISEGVDWVEEKVNSLQKELESVKDNHEKLESLYQEKCSEIEKLRESSIVCDSNLDSSVSMINSENGVPSKRSAKISRIQDELEREKSDIHYLKKRINSVSTTLDKFVSDKKSTENEIDSLKTSKTITENELSEAQVQIEQLVQKVKDLEESLVKSQKDNQEHVASLNQKTITETELSEAQVQVEQLVQKVTDLEESLVKTQKDNQEHVASLNQKTITETELSEAQVQVEQLVQKVTDLEESLVKTQKDNQEHVASLNQKTITENELSEAQVQIEQLVQKVKDLEESLVKSQKDNQEHVASLNQKTITETELSEAQVQIEQLVQKVKDLEESLVKTQKDNQEHVAGLKHFIEKSRETIDNLEINVSKLKNSLEDYEKDNEELKNKIKQLEHEKEFSNDKNVNLNETDNRMEVCDEIEPEIKQVTQNEKNKSAELETARLFIKKEISSLSSTSSLSFDELDKKTVKDLFQTFINEIMKKEEEIIKKLVCGYEKEKIKLEEKIKQSVEAEKKLSVWAKELEADVERLQSDLSSEENKSEQFIKNITELENLLKESEHEKHLMTEKMAVMETDFNVLHRDYEKFSKDEISSATQSLQNVEKQIERAVQDCQAEQQEKFNKMEKSHKLKIEELTSLLDSMKTRNLEIKSNLDCLEISEKKLKSIVDLKTVELEKLTSNIESSEQELKLLTEAYTQLKQEYATQSEKLNEVTNLLKQKCDKMSEYKTHLETIKPEYESLKEQMEDRELRLEKYKTEADNLREDNNNQMKNLRDLNDELEVEKIKSTGLNKQLADITNRNLVIQSQLDKLSEKCEELESLNNRLNRKMRNSTDKEIVKMQTAELVDQNKILQQNLDDATNRMTELQNARSELLKINSELQSHCEILKQEKIELNNSLKTCKAKLDNRKLDISIDEKFDNLLQEKNKIASELEERKSVCIELEKKIHKLEAINKDLDEEMDDIVKRMEEAENGKEEVELKFFDLTDQVEKERAACICGKRIGDIQDQKDSSTDIENIKKQLQVVSTMSDILKKENAELKCKLQDRNIEADREIRSRSSRSPSPLVVSSRTKQRRSDLFNQNRPKELTEEFSTTEILNCQRENSTIVQVKKESSACSCGKQAEDIFDQKDSSIELGNIKKQLEIVTIMSEMLKKENAELRYKLKDANIDSGREIKSTQSSRSSSPHSLSSRSKQRRSDLFNQNRPKELTEELLVTEVTENRNCQCENLRKKVIELEQELALKLAKVKSLQLTLNSEIFPHQKKCKELEELVLTFKRKNNELKAELDRISVHQSLNNDCKKCSRRTLTKKNQYTQCMPSNDRVTMVGEASGVVSEHLKIAKLESDKNELKKLCISRLNQIKELRIAKAETEQELENLRLQTSSVIKNYPTLPSLATKENVPSNILGTLGMKPHNVRKD